MCAVGPTAGTGPGGGASRPLPHPPPGSAGRRKRAAFGFRPPRGNVMPAPATTTSFLELVRKSGLIDVQVLEGFLREHGSAETMPPRKLAGLLVEAGLLT